MVVFLYSCQAVRNFELVPSQANLPVDVVDDVVVVVMVDDVDDAVDDVVVAVDVDYVGSVVVVEVDEFDVDLESDLVFDSPVGHYSGSDSGWGSD